MEPTIFGHYTLLRRIAVGGTAEIFLARRHGLEGFARHLVIKRILPHLAEEPAFVQLLVHEARLAAHLHHGHIVEIHEVGVEEDQAYIAMEYLPGADVGRIFKAAKRRTRCMLLVHSQPAYRAELSEALQVLGVEVRAVDGFEAARRVMADGPIDLALIESAQLGPIRDPFLHELQVQHPELLRTMLLGDQSGRGHGTYAVTCGDTNPAVVVEMARACLRPLVPLELAIQIIRAVADGLDYAHEALDFDGRPLKVVHRDVNPSNVLVSASGTTKLVDFGIAKATFTAAPASRGNLMGTFNYMSPEQTRGEEAEASSDLFCLGTLFYELVTGVNPFESSSSFATMRRIREDTPPAVDSVVPGVPVALARLIERLGVKAPDGRSPSAGVVLAELESVVRKEGLDLSPKRLSRFITLLFGDDPTQHLSVAGTGYKVPLPAMFTPSPIYTPSPGIAPEPQVVQPAPCVVTSARHTQRSRLPAITMVALTSVGAIVGAAVSWFLLR